MFQYVRRIEQTFCLKGSLHFFNAYFLLWFLQQVLVSSRRFRHPDRFLATLLPNLLVKDCLRVNIHIADLSLRLHITSFYPVFLNGKIIRFNFCLFGFWTLVQVNKNAKRIRIDGNYIWVLLSVYQCFLDKSYIFVKITDHHFEI